MTFLCPRHGYYDLVQWLEENVGKQLNSMPIVSSAGYGWRLELDRSTEIVIDEYNDRLNTILGLWKVTIDDEHLAMQFAMRWL